jgi:hypothetical protein
MAEGPDRRPTEGADWLDIELRLVHEAVGMVASGAARRVVLAGLRFANELLGAAGEPALEPGVRLAALWRSDQTGVDIAVEIVSGAGSWPEPVFSTGVPEPTR